MESEDQMYARMTHERIVLEAHDAMSALIEAAEADGNGDEWLKCRVDRINAALKLAWDARASLKTQEGWQLVPKEPTAEMLHAAAKAWQDCNDGQECLHEYRAMLEAAPRREQP